MRYWHAGEEVLLHGARLRQMLGHDVLPVLRLVYAQMAAACAHLAKLLRAKPGQHHVCLHWMLACHVMLLEL